MRLFIAIEVPELVKERLSEIQTNLKKAGLSARFVDPEIVHLTLVFLGTVKISRLPLIKKVYKKQAEQFQPVSVNFSSIGGFPSLATAHVVFIELQGEIEKLKGFSRSIKSSLKKEGIWFDKKPFHPHLTLARVKKGENLEPLAKQVEIDQVQFVLDKTALVKSTLTSQEPVYKKLM